VTFDNLNFRFFLEVSLLFLKKGVKYCNYIMGFVILSVPYVSSIFCSFRGLSGILNLLLATLLSFCFLHYKHTYHFLFS
jgi:hypothetical protein